MTDSRIRVSRSLYLSALADAIDWEETFLATHDPQWDSGGVSCCKPGARCDGYRFAAELLAKYKRARAAAGGREPPPSGKSVPLSEIRENWPAENFGEEEIDQ